ARGVDGVAGKIEEAFRAALRRTQAERGRRSDRRDDMVRVIPLRRLRWPMDKPRADSVLLRGSGSVRSASRLLRRFRSFLHCEVRTGLFNLQSAIVNLQSFQVAQHLFELARPTPAQ